VLLLGAVMIWMTADAGLQWPAYVAGCLGLLLLHERLRREVTPLSALISTCLVYLGTSLFWSMTQTGGLPDTATFAAVSAALVAQARWPTATARGTVVWAVLAGVPLAAHAILPREAAPVAWDRPLFSSTHGVLALTPVVYLALAGTIARLRRDRVWTLAALITLAVWVATAAIDPVEGAVGRFGHGLTAAMALLAPGLAVLVERARQHPWPAIAIAVVAALAWNYWLMVQYTAGMVPKDAPVSFSVLVRQQADVQTRSPYHYPFAFPANLWFAWREGLPADRYELLAFEPRRPALDLVLTRDAARFLIEGWEPPAADSRDSPVWTRDRRAILAVPLALPAGRDIEIAIAARARLDDPPVTASLGIEVNEHEVGRVTVPPAAVTEVRLLVGTEVGAPFRAGYNRLALVSYGVARVDPSDQRPPGPMAQRLGDRPWPVAVHRIRISARTP
jgi:hypothetical protein